MAKLYASKSPDITEREIRNGERTRAIAAQGMVLLKNGGSLPFKNIKTLAAFGSGVRRECPAGTGRCRLYDRIKCLA